LLLRRPLNSFSPHHLDRCSCFPWVLGRMKISSW
jgi:hypothetical protein